jgi:hypothetical protein
LTSPTSPTEPAYPLPRKEKRPWWAVALVTGVGVGVALAGAMGLSAATAAHGETPPHVSLAGIAQQDESAAWRARMEQKLNELGERMARIEGRLERK